MARYWAASTFNGFYVEGRNLERTLAEQVSRALSGKQSEPIMGAGIYIWLEGDEDPSVRVKDIGDRALVEVVTIDRSLMPRPEAPSPDGEGEEAVAAPVTGGPTEDLKMRMDGILGGIHDRVGSTPSELRTKVDLKLEKWERPKPMAISSGGPSSFTGEIAVSQGRGGGGGMGGIIAMLLAIVVLGGAGYFLLTTAGNDPYYLYQPGRQFRKLGNAIGFTSPDNTRIITITAPTRLDTMWGGSPRFVRSEEDTVTTTAFVATGFEELRVARERMPSVIIEPADPPPPSTANTLDFGSLQWNRVEEWEDWFSTEINRGILVGLPMRQDDALWLQSGQNLVQLDLSDLLTPAERIRFDWALVQGEQVRLEVRYMQTLPINRVRTSTSGKLFSVEVRQVEVLIEQ